MAVVVFQVLFFPGLPVIAAVEVILMATVLSILWLCLHRKWHERWLDYRLLTEQFRSALFMAVANVDMTMPHPYRRPDLSYSPRDWTAIAFRSVWVERPRPSDSIPPGFEELRKFLLSAWIEDLIN